MGEKSGPRKGLEDASGAGSAVEPAPSVWDVRERLAENFKRVELMLAEVERSGDERVRLAAAAELRHHIALAEKVLETAIGAEAQRIFEETVLSALEQTSPALRRKVIGILNASVGEAAERRV